MIRLPQILNPVTEKYLEAKFFPTLTGEREFLLIGLSSAVEYVTWMRGRLAQSGFRPRVYGNYDGVEIFTFEREEGH